MRRAPSTTVRDVANRQVVTVAPETTLAQCARTMRDEHVGSVVVIRGDHPESRPIGIVTDRDIVLEAVAPSLDPSAITAGEVMSPSLGTVSEDDDILDALARMREYGVRRLPVIDISGRLAGIVAVDDLLSALAQQLDSAVDIFAAERAKEHMMRPSR